MSGVTGNVAVRSTDVDHPIASKLIDPIGPVFEVTTDGVVGPAASVTVTLDEAVPYGVSVSASTATDPDGPWDVLPVVVDGAELTVRVDRLGLFSLRASGEPVPAGDVDHVRFTRCVESAGGTVPEGTDVVRMTERAVAVVGPVDASADVIEWCSRRTALGR